jgi:hypothetical protein
MLMKRQLKYVMICSLPSVTCINTTSITLSSAAMYSQNGIPAIGAFIIGDEDKYFLHYKNMLIYEGFLMTILENIISMHDM